MREEFCWFHLFAQHLYKRMTLQCTYCAVLCYCCYSMVPVDSVMQHFLQRSHPLWFSKKNWINADEPVLLYSTCFTMTVITVGSSVRLCNEPQHFCGTCLNVNWYWKMVPARWDEMRRCCLVEFNFEKFVLFVKNHSSQLYSLTGNSCCNQKIIGILWFVFLG